MSFTNRGPKGRGVWRAVPFIKNDALENCLIKILRSESPGKTINKNFGVKAKKNLVSYLCMQKFVLKSDTHVRCIKFHRKVNMCKTFPAQVYGWSYWYLSFSNNRTFFAVSVEKHLSDWKINYLLLIKVSVEIKIYLLHFMFTLPTFNRTKNRLTTSARFNRS